MKVVVTGGAGFIGSHLVERLVSGGHDTVVVDNLATGRRSNLAPVIDAVQLLEADIRAGELLDDAFAGADVVFHLAALADIVPSIERPLDYHAANVDGTVSVLEAARRAGVGKVVYAASSSCYGIPDVYPTPETTPARPEYPYALTKWVAEQYVLHWGSVYGLGVVSLRLFNVYGPRSRTGGTYGAVFGVFLAQKLAGEPLTVVGDGTQGRDFVHVTDVARAFEQAATSDVDGVVLNVGTGEPQTVNYLVELIGGEAVYLPRRPGEPLVTQADVSRILDLLGWSAQVPFEAGVAEMVERLEDWRDSPVWTPAAIEDATRAWFEHLGSGT